MVGISNKLAYTLIAIVILVLAVVSINAYGGNTPATMGHSTNEIEPPAGCAIGELLAWGGGPGWICIDSSVFAGGEESPWTQLGNNIFYDQGAVIVNSSGQSTSIGTNSVISTYSSGADTYFRPSTWSSDYAKFGYVGGETYIDSVYQNNPGAIKFMTDGLEVMEIMDNQNIEFRSSAYLSRKSVGSDILFGQNIVWTDGALPNFFERVSSGGQYPTGINFGNQGIKFITKPNNNDAQFMDDTYVRMQINQDGFITLFGSMAFDQTSANHYFRLPSSNSPPMDCTAGTLGAMYFDTDGGGYQVPCICIEYGAAGIKWAPVDNFAGPGLCT